MLPSRHPRSDDRPLSEGSYSHTRIAEHPYSVLESPPCTARQRVAPRRCAQGLSERTVHSEVVAQRRPRQRKPSNVTDAEGRPQGAGCAPNMTTDLPRTTGCPAARFTPEAGLGARQRSGVATSRSQRDRLPHHAAHARYRHQGAAYSRNILETRRPESCPSDWLTSWTALPGYKVC